LVYNTFGTAEAMLAEGLPHGEPGWEVADRMDTPYGFVMRPWVRLSQAPSKVRVPFKLLIFGLVFFLVLYPYPHLFVRHIYRATHIERLIEPNSPALEPVVRRFQAELAGNLTARQLQMRVQNFVYKTVPYDWDWNTWGVANYLPTVAEVLEKGRMDCKGRAVLAASMLRRMRQDARLVGSLRHVWVAVGKNELMGPDKEKLFARLPTGTRIYWRALANVRKDLTFGIAVFPLGRELIIVAAIVLLFWHPKAPRRWFAVGTVLLVDALLFLRLTHYVSPEHMIFPERDWAGWVGMIHVLAGLTCLWFVARRARASAGEIPQQDNLGGQRHAFHSSPST
jgi:hypothetical protein